MKLLTSVFSNVGGRDNNEDNASYTYDECRHGVWVVADGLGGHNAGEIASKIASETITEAYGQNPELTIKNVENIFINANQKILDGQRAPALANGMRTTVVALFSSGDEAIWAHIGDSRFYFSGMEFLKFNPKDHSVSQMAVNLKEITQEEIRMHEDRNKLLRVMGSGPEIKPEISKKPERIQPGDAFLLCTDGFWEYVYETEMEIDLSKSASAEEWVRFMAERISKRVDGKNDNLTAIAVFAV